MRPSGSSTYGSNWSEEVLAPTRASQRRIRASAITNAVLEDLHAEVRAVRAYVAKAPMATH